MKCTKIMLAGFVTFSMAVFAMPTPEQTKKVESLVVDLMRDDQAALKSGKKTRVEVAESAMSLADQAESEAAKLLLMKGAFNLYVRAGEFDRAIETLQSLQTAIPDIPPANMANIIETSLRAVPRKNGGQLYRLLDETKTRMRYTNEAASLEKAVKKTPADRTLRLRLAEHYAYLGKWDFALENFAEAGGKVSVIAKSERDGEEATEKIADFWWDYPTGKAEELAKGFRSHAAKLYEDAIAAGAIKGLNKVQAERRIEEAKGYGENIFEAAETKDGLYCIVDLSGGATAKHYPVSYLNDIPKGGWTDEYKTTKLVLRHVAPGSFEYLPGKKYRVNKSYYLGVFEVTSKQYELVCGGDGTGGMKPRSVVSYIDLRGAELGLTWPKSNAVDAESFIGKIRRRTGLEFDLPTEVQWEYACRAGTKSKFNNGSDNDEDLKSLGACGTDKCEIVGSFKPNRWGLYDMHGNVWEWCLDCAPDSWVTDWTKDPKEREIDPMGNETGPKRYVRGGGFGKTWKGQRCASFMRYAVKPHDRHGDGGFRLCLGSVSKNQKHTILKDSKKYCVIDISKGSKASRYSVTYMAEEPKGGWTDEYKGTKLVLRKIPAGTILIEGQKKEFEKEFYAGVFEVTQKQLELVTGKTSWEKNHVMYGFNRPAVNVDFEMIRGKGKGASVDNDSFIGLLRKRTGLNIDLPTVSEWIYFGRAGSESPFNNGGSTEDDLKMLGRYKGNKNDGKGGYADGPSAVGMYIPNTWGIYDIHGGVSEWCLDNGIEAPIRNPKWGEDKVVEKQRVVMGGHWDSNFSKNQYSGWVWPLDAKKWHMGFRIVAK